MEQIVKFNERINAFIASCGLMSPDKGPVIVTLSGGADSVALLRVLLSLGFDCVAAHCNFHLRGAESDRDERFVVDLCQSLQVRCFVKHMDVAACQRERKVSVEMACRELRYEWFDSLADELHCQAVAVAHHADDNIETFFLNALRGSGVSGLAGMKPRNGIVVRPLLCVSRHDVEQYLKALGQSYVTDSTNLENDYKRNRIRNVVIPTMEDEFPGARKTLQATVEYTRACADLYTDMLHDFISRAVKPFSGGLHILIDDLLALKTSQLSLLLFEITRPYGFSFEQCTDVAEIIQYDKRNGQHFHTSTHTLSVTNERVVIEECSNDENEEIKVDFKNLESLKVKLKLEHSDGRQFTPVMCNGKTVVAFANSLLECRKVVLRHWRDGDRMRPFGLRGTKLISDLFTDAKIPPEARKKVWLLEADGAIVWALGLRAADAFTVKKGSTDFILLECCQ